VGLVVCALSFSSAVFLILELDQPFEGLISSAPLREAVPRRPLTKMTIPVTALREQTGRSLPK
jgi:hypothetical protein